MKEVIRKVVVFKFHYVQMKHGVKIAVNIMNIRFKFHYVQMKPLGVTLNITRGAV